MDDKFEKDVKKALQQCITALNSKVECFWGEHQEIVKGIKVGKPIRQFYYDQDFGIMKVNIKFTYTPEEINFLEKVKSLSAEKFQLVEEYIEQLLKG